MNTSPIKTVQEINRELSYSSEPVYGTIRRSQLRRLTDGQIIQVMREISNILDFRHGKPRIYPDSRQLKLNLETPKS